MMPPLEWEPIVHVLGQPLLALRWQRYPLPERMAASVHRDTRAERVTWAVLSYDGDPLGSGCVPDGPGALEEAQAMALRVLRAWAREGAG